MAMPTELSGEIDEACNAAGLNPGVRHTPGAVNERRTIVTPEGQQATQVQERFGPAQIAVSAENYLSNGSTPVIRLQLGESGFLLTLDGALRLSTALRRQVEAARGIDSD
jgi:hypothetical protein